MPFEDYEAEDFLQDESFLHYCVSTNEEDVQFWTDWVSEHPEKAAAVQQAKELYLMLNGGISAQQFERDEAAFRKSFEKHIGTSRKAPVRRLWRYAAAVAAAVIMLFAINYWIGGPGSTNDLIVRAPQQFSSGAGEKKIFMLPDGSRITLNGASTITVAGNFGVHTRTVSLAGEGYFEIAKDSARPFVVNTTSLNLKVLGTVFNVRAYPGDQRSEAALLSGAVEVSLAGNDNQVYKLRPHQKIALQSGRPTIEDMRAETGGRLPYEVAWTKNRLVFVNQDLGAIAAAIERWYNVRVVFEEQSIREFRYTAAFESKTVQQVLEALKLSRSFRYRIDKNNTIYIGKS